MFVLPGGRRFALRPPFAWTIAVLLAAAHVFLALTAALDESPTFDEPTHLTAGYSYWTRHDYRLDAENGNLPARWAALPLLFDKLRFPDPAGHPWHHSSVGLTSRQFLFELDNDSDAMLAQARLMMSLFGFGLCLVVFGWARSLFGALAGLLAEALMALDPNMLAHTPLVASDMAAAFFFAAATWSFWRLLQQITPIRFLTAALCITGLFLTKMSAPCFLVVAGALTLVRLCSSRPLEVSLGRLRKSVASRTRKMLCFGALALGIGAFLFLSIWTAYGFRYSALTETGRPREILDARWDFNLRDNPLGSVFQFVRQRHLLPEAFVYGATYVAKNSQARPSFLDQHWSNIGFRSFFLRAFLYKTPLAIFGFLALALIAGVLHWRRRRSDAADNAFDLVSLTPILILILGYSLFALSTRLNIGHRHLLPIYPAIFILCGASAHLLNRRKSVFVLASILLLGSWDVTASFSVRPHYLAYFNESIGGPANGYQHLVDSSLDWGQDLPALKEWLDALPPADARANDVYLAYFGVAIPKHYGIKAHILSEENYGGTLEHLGPGFYCVSATILQHVYEDDRGPWAAPYERAYQSGLRWVSSANLDVGETGLAAERRNERLHIFQSLRFGRLCAYLRHQRPIANAGYSILVFRLTERDIELALNSPPAEMAPVIQVVLE